MHYYKFNIAEWAKDTSHLSLKEEAILLRLCNYYLDYESPIPLKTQLVLRKLRIADESDSVEILLEEFFKKGKDGYHMDSLDKIISEYQKRAESNRKNGKLGGRNKNNNLAKANGLQVGSESESNGNQTETETEATGNLNYKLETTNQELETNNDNKDSLSASADAITVLTYLNEICQTKYKHTTASHIKNINARLKEFSLEECKMVIDHKFAEWGNDDRMAAYLRPQTLFGTEKFHGYLMAAKQKLNKQNRHDLSGIEYQTGSF